jgi:hypothetical protein
VSLTAEELRQTLRYDPETGHFTWLVKLSLRGMPGKVAGWKQKLGTHHIYTLISIRNRSYMAHRLAWLYVHGEWPADLIDHINGDTLDNRIVNLRPATKSLNAANSRLPRDNTSGVKGVSWNKNAGKWIANIAVRGKQHYLGIYSNKEKAAEAYRLAAVKFFGDYAKPDRVPVASPRLPANPRRATCTPTSLSRPCKKSSLASAPER